MTLSLRERRQLKSPLPEKALNESELCEELPKAFGKGEKQKTKAELFVFPRDLQGLCCASVQGVLDISVDPEHIPALP